MPIFHQYNDKSGWFVRTSIQNAIITFQLTAAGANRLLEAGIKDGARFRRAVLFDLYRSGDAFTHGTGPGVIEPYEKEQLELDFSNDPEPESIFPRCSSCGSLADLHLVEIKQESKHYAALYCPLCRGKSSRLIDASIPLQFVSKAIFERILGLKGITELDKNASEYSALLDKAFNDRWDELLRRKLTSRKDQQEALFEPEGKQKKLL
jgi:hypothetical protein